MLASESGEQLEVNQLEGRKVYEAVEAFPETRIKDALQSLPAFDDLFLGMQALNLDVVDGYIEQMETDLLQRVYGDKEDPRSQRSLRVGDESAMGFWLV